LTKVSGLERNSLEGYYPSNPGDYTLYSATSMDSHLTEEEFEMA